MSKYKYYSLAYDGTYNDKFLSYSDIAYEFGITRNSVAGRYNRAHKKNSNIIVISGFKIKQIKEG